MKVSKEGTVAEYGMLATDDIEEGEVLFTVPRAALLHPGTSEVSGLLEKGDNSCNYPSTCELTVYHGGFPAPDSPSPHCPLCPPTEKSSLESSSGWVPLLLALLYEYTSPRSHWRPYLSLWTDFKSLDHPMFW